MRKFIILPLLLVLGITSQSFAQTTFNRVYDPLTRDHVGMNMIAHSGGYYLMNANPVDDRVGVISITKTNMKGDESWSKDYAFGEDSLTMTFVGDMNLLRDDSLAITVLVAGDELEPAKKIVAKLAPNGDIMWSTKTGVFENDVLDTVITKVTMPFDFRPTVFSSVSDSLGFANITMTKYDTVTSDMHLSARLTGLDTELGQPVSIEFADVENNMADSTFVVSGFALRDNATFGSLLCHIDSNGVGGRAFMIRDSASLLLVGNEVEQLSPIKFAVGGISVDLLTGQQLGHVTMIDSIDQVLWSKVINFGPFALSTVNGIESFANGDLLVSGEYIDFLVGQVFVYFIKLDQIGNVVWQRQYDKVPAGFTNVESLVALEDDFFTYYGSGINANDASILTQLIAIDPMGDSMCPDTIDVPVVLDNAVGLYEFSLRSEKEGSVDTLVSFVDSPDSLFNLKIVSLLDTVFCPNDPIMVTLDATLPNAMNAMSYEWSTGDTTETLFVEEEGMYMVTVTFDDEDGCYAICDTSIISTYDSTMVSILADLSPYCLDRSINLLAQPMGGLGPYELLWSNGDVDNIINIPFDQTPVSVSAVDQCGIEAVANYILDPNLLPTPDDFGIVFNSQLFCDEGIFRLDIVSDNSANVDGLINIIWTNAAGDTIASSISNPIVPGFGTYAFTGLDDCMYEVGAEITFSEDDLPGPGTMSIELGGFESFCISGVYNLTVVPDGDNLTDFVWSTGQSGLGISVTETGFYSVTAMDCGREITADFTIPEDVIPPVGTIAISVNEDSLCTTGEVFLTAEASGGSGFFSVFEWSTGEAGETIAITDFSQAYIVSTLDCDRMIQDSIVYEPNLDNAVKWPSAFIPGFLNALDADKGFGPVIECPEAVTDYELRVYNRVGQLMFETDDPLELWDGDKDGEEMPGDVYVYYSNYTINGITDDANGTVTLVR